MTWLLTDYDYPFGIFKLFLKALSNVTSFPYTIRVLTTYSSITFLRNEIRKYRGGGINYAEELWRCGNFEGG
jgi:hypothetical protein